MKCDFPYCHMPLDNFIKKIQKLSKKTFVLQNKGKKNISFLQNRNIFFTSVLQKIFTKNYFFEIFWEQKNFKNWVKKISLFSKQK